MPFVAVQLCSVTAIAVLHSFPTRTLFRSFAGTDQYTVWSVDSSGNYISNLIGAVSGTSSTFESLETIFQQDLNGDGRIGVLTVVVEAQGSTSLVKVGDNFFLNPVGGGSGPEL